MGLEMVNPVRRYQRQCRALLPLGHQGYRLRSYKKDPSLHSGYMGLAGVGGGLCVVLLWPGLGGVRSGMVWGRDCP